MTIPASAEPDRDCALCPRLHEFIAGWREREPTWHNAPVPTWLPAEGADSVRLLIVGLAPGLRGANRTGRPFTGDFAGDLLYSTLKKYGFAEGEFEARRDDSLRLKETAITNAVRCVPPENKPTSAEINTCRRFLSATIGRFENLHTIVTLGKIAHDSTVRALHGRLAAHPFKHCAKTKIHDISIVSSYHCSRYNTNTGVLTPEMFEQVFRTVQALLQRQGD
ncbi:MAG: uracil-DNA glycosylase [Oricola sp.]